MANLNIKTKLFLSHSLLILLLLFVSGTSIYYGVRNDRMIVAVKERIVPDTLSFTELEKNIILIHAWLGNISATRGTGGFDKGLDQSLMCYNLAKGILIQQMDYHQAQDNQQTVHELAKIEELLDTYFRIGTRMAQAYVLRGPQAGNVLMQQFAPLAEAMHEDIAKLAAKYETNLSQNITALRTAFFFTSLFALAATAGSVLIGVIMALLIARSITKPIERILEVTNILARGDLTQEVDYRRGNELGQLSSNFNQAMGNLRQLIHQVKDASSTTFSLSEDVSTTTNQSSASLKEIATNIASIREQFDTLKDNISDSTAAIEQIHGSIDSLAGRIENQVSAVTESSSSIEEMIGSINNVAKIAQARQEAANSLAALTLRGGEKIDTTNQIVAEVSTLAQDMQEITGIIKGISSQTNLLSMNASIEAAHAGEYGKGFSVVADEIRKLAESTTKNSKMISSSLSAVMEKIAQATQVSQESRQAFEILNREVSELINALSEINSSMSEMAAGSQQVLHAIGELSQISQEIRQGSKEIRSGAGDVNQKTQVVNSISREVADRISEIDAAAGEINKAVLRLTEMSQESRERLDRLNSEVGKFLV